MKMIDFSKIEKKWQRKWETERIFEAKVDMKKEKFFFTTPYPYISGSLHIGQGRAVIESDIYCRFKRMQGYNVLFPMAFHVSGTPVLGISAAIKNKDKGKIKLYKGYVSAYEKNKEKIKKIVKSFEEPQKIVDFFIPKMIGEYKGLGVGVDWSRSFTSGDMEHQQMVDWQFRKYDEKKYLMKGKYPVLYSPQDESAMGEDDIQDADSNPVEKMEFTLLKFKFKDKFLVAATLRPETVFGQTNLWINPEINYFEAQVGEETWILSKEAVKKLKYQRKDVHEKGYTTEKLLGHKVVAPMIEREILILPSKFVDADVGTGIVTSVPSDAPYDYVALKELQDLKETDKKSIYGFDIEKIKEIEDIEVIPIIKTKYGDKSAVKIVEDKMIILQDDPRLEELTQEVYKEGFHNGFMLDNCEEYAGMSVIEAKEKIKAKMIRNKIAEIFYETSRKAISRSGGKIIVAVLDNQWFLDFNSPGWKDKAMESLNLIELLPENMKKQFEDTFKWLDKRPCARKRGLGTPLPLDKNWVIESLSDSTIYMCLYSISNLIKKHKLKKENLNYEFFDYVFLGKGEIGKVSKSTGVNSKVLKECRESFEYWMPNDHRHTFALHLSNHLSFMIFAYAGLFPEKYWSKKISFHGLVISEGTKMSKSKGNVITLLDIKNNYGSDAFRFYITYLTNPIGTFDWRDLEAENAKNTAKKIYLAISEATKGKKGSVPDYYIHRFNKIKKYATEKINEMKFREYNSSVVFDMLNLINKARLSMTEKELSAFYYFIANDWIKLISPVMPHIAEDLWSKIGEGFVSLAEWPLYDESKINEDFDKQDEIFEKTVSDMQNIIKILKEKQGRQAKKVFLYVLPAEKDNHKEGELERRFGIKVKVYAVNDKEKYDPENKSSKAKPGKPGIYVE